MYPSLAFTKNVGLNQHLDVIIILGVYLLFDTQGYYNIRPKTTLCVFVRLGILLGTFGPDYSVTTAVTAVLITTVTVYDRNSRVTSYSMVADPARARGTRNKSRNQ